MSFYEMVLKAMFLREEFANQTVHVLVGSALPRAVRVGEVVLGLKRFGAHLVHGKLFAVVGGERVYAAGVGGKQGGEGSAHESGCFEERVGKQAVVLRDTWPVLTGNRAFNAECVGLLGAIAAKPCVAAHLAPDR